MLAAPLQIPQWATEFANLPTWPFQAARAAFTTWMARTKRFHARLRRTPDHEPAERSWSLEQESIPRPP
jgi:hypothetical protein